MSHAQRFDAVGAQKGTSLHAVVDAMKRVAGAIESRYDSNSPQVVGAMQHFEQGLALLTAAPEQASPEESGDGGERAGESGSPKPATRRKTAKGADDSSQDS